MKQNFKIRVTPETSREVQEIMFSHGYGWFIEGYSFTNFNKEFLYVYNNPIGIGWLEELSLFKELEAPELTIEQVKKMFRFKEKISFTSDFYWNQEVYFLNGDKILKGNIVMAKWVDEIQNTDGDFVELTFKILVDDPDYSSAFWKNAENCFKSKEELIKKISG